MPPCEVSQHQKVPQLFAATGASKFTDPKNFPWTMGFNPNYFVEGRIYGQYIIKNYPNAKVGILYQNDDLGKDYLNGIKAGLGDKAAKMVVAEASYEVSDPTVDTQILKIKDAGADLFFSASTPKQAAQTIKKIAELAWKPVHILDINATSVGAVMKPAGLEASKGVTANYGKDPPMGPERCRQKYFEFMAKYYPDGDKDSSFNSYGYSTTQLLIHVLKQCGDNLTRENVMKQATSLKNVQLDLSLPGIVANTTPTDYRVNKQLQMMKFNGERWEPFGPTSKTPARRARPSHPGKAIGGPCGPPISLGYYFGISPKLFPTGSTACLIRRESSTAACRCFTASR
jgi:ABC-type branched-subunit amino acid transport system substrate-binding protein